LVLDTNTAISGLLWGGTPGRLIDAGEAGRIEQPAQDPWCGLARDHSLQIRSETPEA
jgi:hypothetical protein